ncbi:endonuclease [Dyadobacter fanqingshengii]|uniref:Endonuclease n=1 Tax=Dyadobacter fanqingshengii TaxID=2906443 RepID=A0A9X1TAH3_9BACT|nr:endonuclease [Dyadobacter fanqingshengii]MCF0041508.1 endonuclease [Dyadobacter fanqingshengii]USJ36773.1 endonuclease [Dyadobacter fanqingshengii]
MPNLCKNKRAFSLWGLFVLVLTCNSTERTNGSSVTDLLIGKDSFMKDETEGQFSAISYNIAGLPAIICSAKTPRASSIAAIGKKLQDFDIVHVQEDFNYHSQLYDGDDVHNYRTETKGAVPFGDGLNTLSKFPLSNVVRVKWNDCTGADCMTPKGFTYTRVQLALNVFIDFYNVHSNAYNTLKAASARRENIKQLSDYIRKHSSGNAVVLMGDLNGRYGFFYDNIQLLTTENGLQDAWITHQKRGKMPEALKIIPAANILNLTDSSETIDKIFFRSSPTIELKTISYSFLNRLFNNKEGLPLSDHHPVSAQFAWHLKPEHKHLSAHSDKAL